MASSQGSTNDRFRILGGCSLKGEVTVTGAKNSVLKLMAASLLAVGTSTIRNVPDIADVDIMADLLKRLGCEVSRDGSNLSITVPEAPAHRADYDLVRKMRASINVLGPLVARVGKAEVALPGGDAIGSRGLDFHIKGLESLGATAHVEHGYVIAEAPNGLTGATIELDFPSERQKWMRFLENLDPFKMLPELPAIRSEKERMFITSRTILTEYYNLKSQEERMLKYFYAAPFNGTVVAIYAEPGAIANPGGQIAKIAKSGDYEVKVPISMADLKLYKENSTADFYDSKNKKIATGKIIRISDVINQQTQSADVYYSVNALPENQIYHGMYLNVSINKESDKETVTLPRVAVKDGKVKVLNNGKLSSVDVMIVSSKPDSVYVTGLTNGQSVVLEQVETNDSKVKFKGIVR